MEQGASLNLVSDNVISGNSGHGLHIIGTSEERTNKNTVYGNYIGTNFDVSLDIPNKMNGIMKIHMVHVRTMKVPEVIDLN